MADEVWIGLISDLVVLLYLVDDECDESCGTCAGVLFEEVPVQDAHGEVYQAADEAFLWGEVVVLM